MGVVFRSGHTMLIPTLLLSFLCLSLSEPGAPWTEEEAKIVKGKIYAILGGSIKRSEDYLLNHPELKSELNEYVTMVRRDQPEWKWPEWPEAASRPNVPKLIRLGFHQCLKNADGSGGCNGCLNNHGMGLETRHNCSKPDDKTVSEKRKDLPDALKTDNSGLEITADILEEIFTNKDFPNTAPSLDQSLADSGKSRADLWSFASAVAVEWGFIRNNRGCDGDPIGELDQDHKHCPHLREKDADCRIEWPEPLKFYTGRSDCSSEPGLKPYETTVEESHPNPQGNGQMTADFFKKDFGLTARESAALLLGAHSFGSFDFEVSQFKYDWTKHQTAFLNNALFRSVVMKPQYYVDPDNEENPYVGDYLGQPAPTRWRVVGRKCGYGGGPYQWFHQYYRCPASNECAGVSLSDVKSTRHPEFAYPGTDQDAWTWECLDGLRCNSGIRIPRKDSRMLMSMRAEPDTPEGCCDNLPEGQKCQQSCQNGIKNEETALAVDVGYYLDFTVDPETGKPGGCPGLAFNEHTKSTIADCGLNKYAPEGEALSDIVEDFAESQANWIRDFLTAFDKMSRNGNSGLIQGPISWFGAECTESTVKE